MNKNDIEDLRIQLDTADQAHSSNELTLLHAVYTYYRGLDDNPCAIKNWYKVHLCQAVGYYSIGWYGACRHK